MGIFRLHLVLKVGYMHFPSASRSHHVPKLATGMFRLPPVAINIILILMKEIKFVASFVFILSESKYYI